MITLYYLFYGLLAIICALAIGLTTHYWHANFQAYPDRLFDGDRLRDKLLNEIISPHYDMRGRYDSNGCWEFYSWNNYALHAVPLVIVVVAAGIMYWPDRVDVVASICGGLRHIGLDPLTC
jgi:hypothetical protein